MIQEVVPSGGEAYLAGSPSVAVTRGRPRKGSLAAASQPHFSFPGVGPNSSAEAVLTDVLVKSDGEVVRQIIDDLNASAVPLTVKRRQLDKDKAQTEVHKMAKQGVTPATGILLLAFLVG